VSGNKALRGIFGPDKEEVAGGWRSLHEELNNLCCLTNIVRVMKSRTIRCTRHACITHGRAGKRKLLSVKPEEKTPFGRPRHRWEFNIKMELREIMHEDVEWVHLKLVFRVLMIQVVVLLVVI
jgi:hypothetical protein